RHEDIVSVLKWKVLVVGVCEERKHSPVDQVGTVTFCCVLNGDIRPASQDLLAGSRLLAGRAVTRFYCEDGAAHTDVALSDFRISLPYRLHHRFQLFKRI